MVDEAPRQSLHATVYCQSFSDCGKYLVTGTNFGHLAVYNLSAALSPDAGNESWKPVSVFKAHDGPIYALTSTERFLISGGSDTIQAWLWADLLGKNPKVSWSFDIKSTDQFGKPETNTLTVCQQETSSYLYAGCGDNRVHVWDIASGQYVRGLAGHTDYIHSVAVWNAGRDCVSASEDGSVRIWDTRHPGQAVSVIEPHRHEVCARPRLGVWMGCVAVDKAEDWLICGGGPHLCMWHLRSLTPTTVFKTNSTANTVLFQDDSVISAGNEAFVRHWSVNGEQRARVPCSPTNVFSVAINEKTETNKVLSVAGNCNNLDICTNFGYRAFSLTLY